MRNHATRTEIRIRWSRTDELKALLVDPDACRHLFGQPSLITDLLDRMKREPQQAFWYRPAHLSANGIWVATGGFKGPPHDGIVEIGYRVHPHYRRRGHASSLVRWLCRVADEQGLTRVLAVTASTNLASQGVLAQNGFVHTGDFLSDSQQWLQRWQYSVPEPWTGPA